MKQVGIVERWRNRVRHLKIETYALYLACRDPRVPWYAKALVAVVVGYAFSPIDLIPDFIPVLGYLDDLVLVPLGVTLALRMIPRPVLDQCRENAQELLNEERPKNWVAAGLIILVWLLFLSLVLIGVARLVSGTA